MRLKAVFRVTPGDAQWIMTSTYPKLSNKGVEYYGDKSGY